MRKDRTRDHVDAKGMKHRDAEIVRRICPFCGHHRAWISRGDEKPCYSRKCTRCGRWELK